MPFDTAEVARQIEQSRQAVNAEASAHVDALELALRIYRAVGETEWDQRAHDNATRRWVGVPLTPLGITPHNVPCAPAYCVAASDSSFVAPDKHRGAFCHLINVGRVMVRYADPQAAELDNVPRHYTDLLQEGEEILSGRVLEAKCALRELEELYDWTLRYGAEIALVDGSLMQLPLVLSKDPEVVRLTADYFRIMEAFEDARVPVIGYISQPASHMVMRAIRMLACDKAIPCEQRPSEPCGCQPLWRINDAELFWELLENGMRSPVFEPVYPNMVGPNVASFKSLVFSYLATQYEIVRLEYPVWVADRGLLDRATQIMLHQCNLGKGYPNVLTLAHQYAVLHNTDREAYYFLLERAGLMRKTTEKAHGKRLIGQSI